MATANPWGQLGPWANFGQSNGAMFYSPQMLENAGFNQLPNGLWQNGNFYAQNAPQNQGNTDDTALPNQGGGITQFYQGDPYAGGTQLRILGDQATQGPYGSFQSAYDPTIGNYTTQDAFAQGVPYIGSSNSGLSGALNAGGGLGALALGAGGLFGAPLASSLAAGAGAGGAALSASDAALIDAANAGAGGAGTVGSAGAGSLAAAPAANGAFPLTGGIEAPAGMYSVAGASGVPGGGLVDASLASMAPAAAAGGGGLLSGLTGAVNGALGTSLGTNDIAKIGAGLGQGALGYLGAGQQADAYQNVANQNLGIGAPYRDTLAASYQPGFNLMSQPGYGDAFNRAADISARSWSARAGNPSGNPTAQAGILNDVWNQSYLPALSNYRGQLGQFGGLGLNTAGMAQLGGAQNAGSGLGAVAFGIDQAFGSNPLDDYLKKLTQGQQQQPYQLNIGGNPYGVKQ